MKVEITKKVMLVASTAILFLAIGGVIGYYMGMESAKSPKGDGSHFYMEHSENRHCP